MKIPTLAITRPLPEVAGDRRGPAGQEQGFTLLEMMVVLGLLALMMGLVVPSMYGAWHRAKERASLRELMTTMRLARSLAASSHRRVRVFLDLDKGSYRVEGTSRSGQLSRRFRLGDAHLIWEDRGARQGYIAFYGDGSSSGGHLTLTDLGGNRQVLEVEIITGKVTLKTAKT